WLIICPTASSSTFFDPLIYFRCSFSFRHKNTPLDNHIQRGETSQLFYKHRDFVLNIASFLQTSRLYFKPTNEFNVKTVYLGFTWVVRFNFLSENWRNIDLQKCKFEDLENIEICDVKGPYCPNDKREMKVTRTYFGRYKYKCPKCKYKNKLFKNHITLVNDTIDEFRSKFR